MSGEVINHEKVPALMSGEVTNQGKVVHLEKVPVLISDEFHNEQDPALMSGEVIDHEKDPSVMSGKVKDHEKDPALMSGEVIDHEKDTALMSGDVINHEKDPVLMSCDVIDHEKYPALKSGDIIDHEKDPALMSGDVIAHEKDPALMSGDVIAHEKDPALMSGDVINHGEDPVLNSGDIIDHEKDLPLMSNISDIHIFHYILQLKSLMETKELVGSVTLFKCSEIVSCTKCSKQLGVKLKVNSDGMLNSLNKKDNINRSIGDHNYTCTDSSFSIKEMVSTYRSRILVCQRHLEKGQTFLPVTNSCDDFKLILDSCDIHIDSVEELDLPVSVLHDIKDNKYNFAVYKQLVRTVGTLKWTMDKHCTTVWKEGTKDFPDVVRIHYRTTPSGQSLKWTVDQEEKCCVFTHGHWINNRSFFPSQDAPTAMATWQAEIEVKEELRVVMSGDKVEQTYTSNNKGWKKEYFYTNMEMPSSTLSLAIGSWDCKEIVPEKYRRRNNFTCKSIKGLRQPCRLIGPTSMVSLAYQELQRYIPVCMKEVHKCLGPYPFTRLDILIVPPCFDSLGMACPSVMYISQSLLSMDYSMFVRIAHEICHSWFGLVIGPTDWTEEWLTEGFCSYLEDIIHINVKVRMKLIEESDAVEERQLRSYLKYKTLLNEINTTDDKLQMLRPNKDLPQTSKSYVKDGMNPDKRFLQVHYLKGFFLLCYLENFVGKDRFLKTLHAYIIRYHKELVTSQEVITFIFNALPELSKETGLTENMIYEDWLDKPGMPQGLEDYKIPGDNMKIRCVNKQVEMFRMYLPSKGSRKRKRTPSTLPSLENLSSLQLVLFLEVLLEEDNIPCDLITYLKTKYCLMDQNADVQHRWCELVIKHKLKRCYKDLEQFIMNHQAMGVYLFGEMVLSGCKQQKKLAEKCFNSLKVHMEPDPLSTVNAMLYGT